MKIKQFEDKGLAHFSYAVLSEKSNEIILVDPARDPQPYYDYAKANDATIAGVIETHPHADFVSSHLEIYQTTRAKIYISNMVAADYPHESFDEGDRIVLGELKLKAIHTPGHSPDSISIIVEIDGKAAGVFSGDTLFIGDVGRPDLREKAGNITAKQEELARQMYHSTREKLMKLPDDVIIYPAHGSGSLCGKSLSEAKSSTLGAEKIGNYALQPMSEEEFVKLLLEDQPFIPKYFPYDVILNKKGAPAYEDSINNVKKISKGFIPEKGALIVDGRPQKQFKKGHLEGAFNIQNGEKFETWLGSIIGPEEKYYLVAGTDESLHDLIRKAAKIGYELNIAGAFIYENKDEFKVNEFDLEDFKDHQEKYTIVDIRNASERKNKEIFGNSINIPLPELRERTNEVPINKPVVVHCAGGYRSAAGSSILASKLPVKVWDLSEDISQFIKG